MAVTFTFTISDPVIPPDTTANVNPDVENAANAIRDLDVDDEDGELVLSEGDLVFNRGARAVASDIKARCLTFGPGTPPDGDFIEGEYFLDTSIGVNYWGAVFRGAVNESDARSAFSVEIAKTPGVLEVRNIVSNITDRGFSLDFDAFTDLGQVISATLAETTEGA